MFVISREQEWDIAGAGNNTQWNTDTDGVFPSLIIFIKQKNMEGGTKKRKAKENKMKQREAKKK